MVTGMVDKVVKEMVREIVKGGSVTGMADKVVKGIVKGGLPLV